MRRTFTAVVGTVLTAAAMLTTSAAALPATPVSGSNNEPTTARTETPANAQPANAQPADAKAADAQAAAALWHCNLYGQARTCTRITSAPSSGVQVLDHVANRVVTLHNGNSVFLSNWWRDTSGKCGVNGDPYVWYMGWFDSTGTAHYAYIGDYYLATGGKATWGPFPTYAGSSRTWNDMYVGLGSGSCNVFPFP